MDNFDIKSLWAFFAGIIGTVGVAGTWVWRLATRLGKGEQDIAVLEKEGKNGEATLSAMRNDMKELWSEHGKVSAAVHRRVDEVLLLQHDAALAMARMEVRMEGLNQQQAKGRAGD